MRRLCLVGMASVGIQQLTGCAAAPKPPPQGHVQAYWAGRLSLKTLSQPPQHTTAGFTLEGSSSSGELVLLTPLGTTVAKAQWSPTGAQLQQGAKTTHYADMNELTVAILGSVLPVSALFAWLAGNNQEVPGWTAQLDQLASGKLTAHRTAPLPMAEIRILLDTFAPQ